MEEGGNRERDCPTELGEEGNGYSSTVLTLLEGGRDPFHSIAQLRSKHDMQAQATTITVRVYYQSNKPIQYTDSRVGDNNLP